MARLLVLRGETLDRELDLTGQTVRIGRGQQNDVVLEDPGKSVSRNHAEVRFEGGRYVLVDLESQNGLWVSGARVPYVVLEPNVVASLGPFRLMLDPSAPTPGEDPATSDEGGLPQVGDTYYDDQPQPGAPSNAARSAPGAADAGKQGNWFVDHQRWLLAGAAALLIGAGGFAVTRLAGGPAKDGSQQVEALLKDVDTLINNGDCTRALSDHIEPALAIDPANPDALALKNRAEACESVVLPPSTVATTSNPVADHLQAATEQIDRRECLAALTEHINPALAIEPANTAAADLKVRADACVAASTRTAATPAAAPASVCGDTQVAKRLPPEDGGLELANRCESQREYGGRVQAMKARYDEANGALASGAYQRAAGLFEGIVRDASARYKEAGARLVEARTKSKEAAQAAYVRAQEFEKQSEWDRALQEFRRAHDMDPDRYNVEGDIRRIAEIKTRLGQEKCKLGDAEYIYPNRTAQALQAYEEALKLLPPTDPCFATARERIAALKK